MNNSFNTSDITDHLTKVIREQFKIEFIQFKKELQNSNFVQKNTSPKEFISRKETAELLDISYVSTYAWVEKGILKPKKIGSKTYFKYSDIILILEASNPDTQSPI